MHYISDMADSTPVSGLGSEFKQHIQQIIDDYGDEKFLLSLIEVFIRDGMKALEQLRNSVETGDVVRTHTAAHSLKNMLGVLRFQKGMDLADLVCTQLDAGISEPDKSGLGDSPSQELLGFTTRLIEDCRALITTSKID